MRLLLLVSLVACAAPRVEFMAAPARCVASSVAPSAVTFDDKQNGPIARVSLVGLADPRATERLVASLRTEPGQLIEDAPFADDLRTLWRSGLVADARVEVVDHDVTFAVTPHPLIASVSIAGVPRDARELRRLVWLAGTPFDPARVQRAMEVARQAYVARGYIDAAIDTVFAGGALCFDVSTGARFVVGAIHLTGELGENEISLAKALGTKPGKPLDDPTLERDVLVIADELANRGHLLAKVSAPRITRAGSELLIEFRVAAGPVFHVGTAQLGGIMQGPVPGLHDELASRARIRDVREQLEKRFGDGVLVVPQTKLDTEHAVVDLTFEVTWKKP